MSVVRRFLVAPSLVRLIRKERGGGRITEGYFAPQGGRTSFVRVDGQQCHLVLVNAGPDGTVSEERTDVPRAHGDALLDVCPGKAAYDRTALSLAGREVHIDRYVTPGSLDVVSVSFDDAGQASGFTPPPWFGREISNEPAFGGQAVALQGVPPAEEIGLTNAALDAVLDLIEPRFGFGRYGSARPDGETSPLRRIVGGAAPAAEAPPAAPEPAPPEPAADHHEPQPEPAHPQTARAEGAAPEAPQDARIDDVIESLSQALGAAIQQPHEPAEPPRGDSVPGFERWTVRPRRNQQQS